MAAYAYAGGQEGERVSGFSGETAGLLIGTRISGTVVEVPLVGFSIPGYLDLTGDLRNAVQLLLFSAPWSMAWKLHVMSPHQH